MEKARFNIHCNRNFEYTHTGTCFEAAFYGSNRSFWRKTHLRKNSFFNAFWINSQTFLAFYPNNFCRFVKNCILRFQCNLWWQSFSGKKTICFSSSSDCERKSFGTFRSNFLGRVVKTAFYFSWESFWGKTFSWNFLSFSDIESKFFWPWSKIFRRSCQYCIFRVLGSILRNKIFLKKF